MKPFIILASVLTLFAFATLSDNWNIDPDYSVLFSGKKAEGTFSGMAGTIVFDPNDLARSKMDVSVDAATIKTGNSTKDRHAKGESWLDAAKYPQIKFVSSNFTKSGDQFLVSGSLELHGTKKDVLIPFSYSEQGNKALFTGAFKINRKDYGIKGNLMGFAVGEEFTVTLRVPVTKKS